MIVAISKSLYDSSVQFRARGGRAHYRASAVKVLVLGSSAFVFVQSTTTLLSSAPEPFWMVVWGLALLVLASGARSLLHREAAPTPPASAPVASAPKPRKVVASVVPTTNWREALVAKLMADRAQASS
jgi:hypothetical protein